MLEATCSNHVTIKVICRDNGSKDILDCGFSFAIYLAILLKK